MGANLVTARKHPRFLGQDTLLTNWAQLGRLITDGKPAIGVSIAAVEGPSALG